MSETTTVAAIITAFTLAFGGAFFLLFSAAVDALREIASVLREIRWQLIDEKKKLP